MDKPVKQIIRSMRSERCPERVFEEVQRTIAATRPPATVARRIRAGLGFALASLLIFLAFVASRPGPSDQTATTVLNPPPHSHGTGNHELYAALASIGLALQEAGTRSGTLIIQETLPLFERGIETTRNAITLQNKP